MKTKNEKSIEQEAFDNYASDLRWKNSKKYSLIFALIITILSIPIEFNLFIAKWGNYIDGFEIVIICFIAGLIGLVGCGVCMFSFVFKTKKEEKIIFLLSDQEKKKIISDYINEQIKQSERNNTYCINKIRPLKESINYHEKKIEKFQKKLENI